MNARAAGEVIADAFDQLLRAADLGPPFYRWPQLVKEAVEVFVDLERRMQELEEMMRRNRE